MNLAHLNNLSFPNITVSKGAQLTVGFWIFLSGLTNITKLIHVIVPDHIVITIRKHNTLDGYVESYCIQYQSQNQLKDATAFTGGTPAGGGDENIEAATYIQPVPPSTVVYPPHGYAFDKVTMNKIEGFWFYTRCAINAQTDNFYVLGSFRYSSPYPDTYSKVNIVPSSDPKLQIMPKENLYPDSKVLSTHPNKAVLYDLKSDTVYKTISINPVTIQVKMSQSGTTDIPTSGGQFIFIKNLYVFNTFLPSSSLFHY